tara:strand:- start:5 stop:427 length:423 start_codon:yes stop_codon:yes gene_type:complete
MKKTKSFNDKMVSKTVIPAIYLWLLACAAVVGMGIYQPDVVLTNLDGFIALIAIIGGVAAPALQTVLRMWEAEQQIEIDGMPDDMGHDREQTALVKAHEMELEKIAQKHSNELKALAQKHQHTVDLHREGCEPITKKKTK